MKKAVAFWLAVAFASLPVATVDSHAQELRGVISGPPLISSQRMPMIRAGRHHAVRSRGIPSKAPLNIGRALRQAAAGDTIAFWNAQYFWNTNKYQTVMVGTDVLDKQPKKTLVSNIPTVIIPVKFVFTPQNFKFDPTVVDPECSPTSSPLDLTKASPGFSQDTISIAGNNLGTGTFIDLFQRANFWDYVKPKAINEGYHVNLNVTVGPTLTVIAQNYIVEYGHSCGTLGLISMADWQAYIEALMPQLKATISPTMLPVFLIYNVAMFEDNLDECCVAGFHSVFKNSAFGNTIQTYATLGYFTNGLTEDSNILVHELAEWLDDPLVNNPTPPWGHIGQVPDGCQDNLEVGDPLTDKVQEITWGGKTYHVQDLAFLSWFYRFPKKDIFSVSKRYSLYAKLQSFSANCPP